MDNPHGDATDSTGKSIRLTRTQAEAFDKPDYATMIAVPITQIPPMQESNASTNGSHPFQAEIRQLLDIVVHSLYTDREIFLRELISNASDSLEKLRHLQGVEKSIYQDAAPLEIRITTDETAGTLTITDSGIGMNREELARNLGTIAHSGTRRYLEALKENGGGSANMIGQFGVGFYAAFMVADEVKVFARSWQGESEDLVWTSDGGGSYAIDGTADLDRGCRIVLTLKEDAGDYAKESTVRRLIETYSNFVGFPIFLNGTRINEIEALWLKGKNEVTEEQYTQFYKFAAHAWDEPAYRLHFSADAPLAINALVFVPGENPERWGLGQVEPGVALYCRKVLIAPKPEGLLPAWMRFLKGVIDSEDLPLNISRESMQDSALVKKLGDVISKRVLKMLENESTSDPAKYLAFYKKFERFLKEGIATDRAHHEALAKLLRFESTMTPVGEPGSLSDYRQRAKENQDSIYYLIGPSREVLASSPYLEALNARGLEVLLLTDPVDQYVIDALREFDGKPFVSIDRTDLALDDHPVDAGEPLDAAATESLREFLATTLGDRVAKVGSGNRLIESPAVALIPTDAMNANMRRMMQAMDENFKEDVKVDFEFNPRHPLIHKLAAIRESQPETAALVAEQLLDNALLSVGLLEDSRPTVKRVQQLMEKVLGA